MTQTHTDFASAHAGARLGSNHGYRIAGDLACLNAELAISADRQLAEQWALQLWACDAPYGGGALRGTKIAEAPLAVNAETQPQQLYAEAFARLPAGDREYSMVLVLASGAEGSFDRVHDFANYPAREHFTVPRLCGEVSHVSEPGHVTLSIESVENPRSEENLSGTLALELWALAEPYTGGQFTGVPLAGVELGRLAGREKLAGLERRLALATPPAAYPHSALMLREWTADGYVTRDFRAFTLQVPESDVVGAPEIASELPAQPVVEAQPAAANDKGLVSISHASLDELVAVPGLNRKLAAEIIKARPYRAFEDLMRVRGIGEKTLRRLRSVLTV